MYDKPLIIDAEEIYNVCDEKLPLLKITIEKIVQEIS